MSLEFDNNPRGIILNEVDMMGSNGAQLVRRVLYTSSNMDAVEKMDKAVDMWYRAIEDESTIHDLEEVIPDDVLAEMRSDIESNKMTAVLLLETVDTLQWLIDKTVSEEGE